VARGRRAALRTLALAAALAACGSPQDRFAAQVERARELADAGEAQGAILEYQNALKLEPENAEVHERIGDLYRSQSRFAEALGWYRQAARLDPGRVSAAMNEARLLVFSDQKRAAELVETALRERPDVAIVHVTASQLALARGDTAAALEAARRATELGPDDEATWVQLGSVHQARIRESQQRRRRPAPEVFEAAIEAFERVDRMKGGHPRAQVERARTLGVWGRHEEAAAGYRAAIELARSRGNAVDAVAAALAFDDYARERRDNALRREALRLAVAVRPDDLVAWERLARLVGGQRGHTADEVYQELLAARPDDAQAHVLFVSHLLREERDDEAVAHLEKALDEGDDDPVLLDQLLRVRIGQARYPEARDALARLQRRFPDDRTTRMAEARLAIGEGRNEDGIRILRALVEEQEELEPLRLLALAEHRRGEEAEASAAMDRALALSPRPPLAVLRLDAQIKHAAGDFGGVLRDLQIVAGRGEPLTPEEQVLGATSLYEMGRVAAGRAVFDELLAAPDAPAEAALEFARLERARDPKRAHEVLAQAWSRAPGDHALLAALVRMEVATGQAPAAVARVDGLLASGQANARTLLLRAELLAGIGSYAAAEADVLRVFEVAPKLPGAADLLFEIYRAQGKLADARRSFEQAEAAGVLHPGARQLLARLVLADGESERARDLLEQVLREQPGSIEVRRDLAIVLATRGEDLERALAIGREAEALSEGRPDAIDAVGFVHLRAGRAEEALASFQRAGREASRRPDGRAATYHYHEGLALRALGREGAALAAFRRSLRVGGAFPEADAVRRELEAPRERAAAPRQPS
jgi:tetratricopeptide (TPR) repeat protein